MSMNPLPGAYSLCINSIYIKELRSFDNAKHLSLLWRLIENVLNA